MKVLRVRPKHYPEVIDIDCSLESLQKEVEGKVHLDVDYCTPEK